MSKLSNALTMLELLSNHRKYSIQELADILEVSPRMVRSYKEDLEKSGIIIDTIRGFYGGYILNQSINIPKRKFTASDYEFLRDLKVSVEDRKRLDVLADKIRGVYLSSGLERKVLDEDVKPTYNIIERAIKEKRKVRISYYSYTKGITERVIHPLDMFYTSNGWGCAAFCELRKDLRHFELRRIESIELLQENFE